ncbi:MAG: polysaccharide deacetylase family protein [Betaproteobacteria bacterium]
MRTRYALLITACRTMFIVAATALIAPNACAQSIAFTFDDGPSLSQTPLLTPEQRNHAILDALAKHKTTGALFVTVANGADRPEGLALAKAWGLAGHAVGNHTVTHLDLNKTTVTLAQYQKELLDCDAVIRTLPGYRKWFRFTYLREGNTPEKRDGMRAFLNAEGYRNAYVSIDTSDWRLDSKLLEVLNANPAADTASIKRAYLAHLWQRASAYRDLAQKLQGRDIPQVILLHHNLINAMWLDEAIGMFKSRGWTITTPDVAFSDPVYQLQPDRLVAGQSLLLSMARTLGLGKFDGWERLVDDGDFEIGELKRAGM